MPRRWPSQWRDVGLLRSASDSPDTASACSRRPHGPSSVSPPRRSALSAALRRSCTWCRCSAVERSPLATAHGCRCCLPTWRRSTGLALIACAGNAPMLVAGVVIAAASSGMAGARSPMPLHECGGAPLAGPGALDHQQRHHVRADHRRRVGPVDGGPTRTDLAGDLAGIRDTRRDSGTDRLSRDDGRQQRRSRHFGRRRIAFVRRPVRCRFVP